MAWGEARAARGRRRGLRWLLVLVVGLCSMVLPGAASARQLPIPPLFKLEASNGYSVLVLGAPSRQGRPAAVAIFVFVRGRAAEATYFAPAAVTENSIQADLGELGQIDVDFHPSGRATKERSACGGKKVAFDSGFYEGNIEFTGEEGYTQVHATRAKGDLQFVLDIICPGAVGQSGAGPGAPGAELRVRQRASGSGPSFVAHKNRPSDRAFFEAGVSEKRDGIGIERFVRASSASEAFEYDPFLQTATVEPPAPFAGRATFRRNAAPAGRWTGTLSVDFPGRSNVSLTAGPVHASIIHAEWQNRRP